MNYRTLGRTGIKVSPYCLGAMMFGGVAITTNVFVSSTKRLTSASISLTPPTGTATASPRRSSARRSRDNVVLATKVSGAMGEDPNQQGNSRRWIKQAVEASLRRLQTDHIDLYQIHRPSPDTDIEETLSVLPT
jgi:aryl-alcohol dehydrogenase-like predicted oxidoreductase